MTDAPPLPRSAPEAQGIASAAVRAFLEAAAQELHALHSVMLVRHGTVVAEGWWAPYRAAQPHMLFSLSKSFTSTAIGLAVAEGLLSLDDPVLDYFPDDRPDAVSAHLAAMQLRHLLSMSTGHAADTMSALNRSTDGNWARAFLACPVEHPPGTHFLYNTGATYMLSAILQRRTGVTLLEYLQPRLLTPLGIADATWERCPRGVCIGGYGLSATTEAVARFGQLHLQRGVWQGRQLLPSGWVDEATRAHIASGTNPDDDWAQGYGYQFWRCRHGAYRGDGAFGQFCVVLPEQDAVLAITGGLREMQPVLNLVWTHLLPAFGAAPLPADEQAHGALAQTLRTLMLPIPTGRSAPAAAAQRGAHAYQCAPNSFGIATLSLAFARSGCTLTLEDAGGAHLLVAGDGRWQLGRTSFMAQGAPRLVAIAGVWASEETYLVQVAYVETPFCVTLTFRLTDAHLTLDVAVNVSFGATSFPQVVGHAASAEHG